MVTRLHGLHKKNRALTVKVRRLQTKLEKAIETDSVVVDEETSLDFEKIMEQEEFNIAEKFSDDSFQSLFWNQQKLALSKTGSKKNGVRWHPMILRWCIYLRHQSSKAYETIRDSGCIALPSQRTLRDYSNAVKAEAGFSSQVDNQLLLASKLMTSAKYHNLIVVLIDEMHIREDLVYNKHTGKLVGFTDIGDINNHLMRFEKSLDSENTPPPLAKSMVSFMVKGLFTFLKFPYAQFPCVSLVGEQLFPLFWEAVFRLERIGFKVIATTFDGASVNRRLVALHDLSDKLVYKILNIHAEEKRYIYCFSDPPHLIKTVRN
ncbi:PREDICTED: uncharacterized protein LOC109586734, partial [Amphimedon queenslandica]|uniref:Transposable element P transposase-like RNase H domain-containing protein n=2 Tax=Amphimedon queenslandica TaxID=400682 RepID=A0AAN0JNV9_AMPQE